MIQLEEKKLFLQLEVILFAFIQAQVINSHLSIMKYVRMYVLGLNLSPVTIFVCRKTTFLWKTEYVKKNTPTGG